MDGLVDIFRKREVKRIIIFALMIFILYSVRSMINIILLTFIFTFLMDRLVEFTAKRVSFKTHFARHTSLFYNCRHPDIWNCQILTHHYIGNQPTRQTDYRLFCSGHMTMC